MNQCPEALNVDWKDTTLAHKRGGSAAVTDTGGTAFSSGLQTIERHVPGAVETAAELWGVDGAATPIWKRMVAGTSFANVTVDDAVSTRPQDVQGVALNGKRFFAYDSTQDRLHVYDPNLASPRVRRVNFTTPAAPTAADTVVGGAYAAVLRYYRVRWLQLNIAGTVVVRRSEAGASVAFTPNGGFTGVVITQPTPPGEGETHWEIEASANNLTWAAVYCFRSDVQIMVAIATTTKTDTVVVTDYPLAPISDAAGTYAKFPSVKYLITDGNRLIGLAAWEAAGATSGGKQSRAWYTPVLGSTDKADDERVPMTTTQKNFFDCNENDGGGFTGGGGPIDGIPYGFKYRQIWKFRPTGDVTAPYLPRKIRDDIGCIAHKTICIGEDEVGQAALYFLSHRGPYRITLTGGVQYLGRDNQVTWRSMNLAATTVVAHATYYPDLHQWWCWIATGSANDPDVKMMFDVQLGFPDENGQIRGGWAKHTGDTAVARCSCLMSNTLGASMSLDLKPYIGRASGTAIQKCDTTATDDAGTTFQAYVTSRPLLTTPDLLRNVGLAESTLVGKALAGSDVTVTINRDFGLETRATAVSLAPAASETRVVKKVEGSEMGSARVLQMTIGDSAANTEQWTIDALVAPVLPQEVA
jgi:hypothetical protein